MESADKQPVEEPVKQNREEQGLVYPPPPSFYQNMAVSPERPPLPSPPPMLYGYAPQRSVYPTNAPPLPPYLVAPPPVKRSRKWIWFVVITLSVAFLGSVGLCGWAFSSIFTATFQQATGSVIVVNDYYTAIQAQNYAAAYSYLAPQGQISGLTQDQFVQQAQNRDTLYGVVVSYVLGQSSFASNPSTGPDLSYMTITVNVTRNRLSYSVLLTVHQVGGSWKITDFDRI